jgi:hypothetical protein
MKKKTDTLAAVGLLERGNKTSLMSTANKIKITTLFNTHIHFHANI